MAQRSRFTGKPTVPIAVIAALAVATLAFAQGVMLPVEFNATAIANDNLTSGAGRVLIRINRWSSEAERRRLVDILVREGSPAALEALRDIRPVGSIRTPDSLAYDLRYAHRMPGDDGGDRIVVATDRPVSAWEAWYRPRISEYPFTVIQMQIERDGTGKGTMSYATRVLARDNIIELENYTTAPVMLTEIESRTVR